MSGLSGAAGAGTTTTTISAGCPRLPLAPITSNLNRCGPGARPASISSVGSALANDWLGASRTAAQSIRVQMYLTIVPPPTSVEAAPLSVSVVPNGTVRGALMIAVGA